MTTTIQFAPPQLMPWLTEKEKRRNVVLLDIEVDLLESSIFRFDLNVVFSQIPVTRKFIQQGDFYIATSGAEIIFALDQGIVKNYTGPHSFEVNYSNTETRIRKSSVSLKPEINDTSQSTNIGNTNYEAGIERKFTSAFSCRERDLVPIHMGDMLFWILNLPRGEKVVRDFLLGNLYLYAEGCWNGAEQSGWISVRPLDIRFYNNERKPINGLASVVMLYQIWEDGIHIQNPRGTKISFKVK